MMKRPSVSTDKVFQYYNLLSICLGAFGNLWHVSFETTGALLQRNLLRHISYGEFDPFVKQIRSMARTPTRIELIVNRVDLGRRIGELNAQLASIRNSDPARQFYLETSPSDTPTLRHGMWLPYEDRPKISTDHLFLFHDLAHYTAVIGMAAVRENELSGTVKGIFEGAKLKLIKIPTSTGTTHLGIFDTSAVEKVPRLWAGTILGLYFDIDSDAEDTLWHAVVLPPLPITPQDKVALLVSKPYSIENGQIVLQTTDSDREVTLDLASFAGDSQARQRISAAPSTPVDFIIQNSDHPFVKQIYALQHLQDASIHGSNKMAINILLGQNNDLTPAIDLFRHLPGTYEEQSALVKAHCKGIELSPKLDAVLNGLRKIKSVVIVEGMAGTGKSTIVRHAIQAMLSHPKPNGEPHHVAIFSSSNDLLDDIALQYSSGFESGAATEAKVVRMHSRHYKRKAASTNIQLGGKVAHVEVPFPLLDFDLAEYLPEGKRNDASIVQTIKKFEQRQEGGPVSDYKLATMTFKSRATETIRMFEGTQNIKIKPLIKRLEAVKKGKKLSEKERIELAFEIKNATKTVLQDAPLICMTPTVGADPMVRDAIATDVEAIVIEQANRFSEADFWIILAYYYRPDVPIILVGDEGRLGLFSATSFTRQDSSYDARSVVSPVSAMKRQKFLGARSYRLTTQYKFGNSITDVLAKFIGTNDITVAPGVNESSSQISGRELLSHLARSDESDRSESNVIAWDVVRGASVQDYDTSSQFNRLEASVMMGKVIEMINHDTDPADIAILVPYDAQMQLIARFKERVQKDVFGPQKDISQLVVSTIDKFQVREVKHVLYGVTITESIGFQDDARRPYSGLCRGRDSIQIFGNFTELKSVSGFRRCKLGDVMKSIQKAGLMITLKDAKESTMFKSCF